MLYHTTYPGKPVDDFKTAVAKAISIAIQNHSNEVAIAIHSKTNLDGVISDAIGEDTIKVFQKPGGTINIEKVTIFLITEKICSDFKSGVLIALHTNTKYLAKLLSDTRATDLIYIPFLLEELNDYLLKNNSTVI